MQDLTGAVQQVSRLSWVDILLLLLALYFAWKARWYDRRKEAAYSDHCADPQNPVHLARFGLFGSMAASAKTVSRICIVGYLALAVFINVN